MPGYRFDPLCETIPIYLACFGQLIGWSMGWCQLIDRVEHRVMSVVSPGHLVLLWL